MVWAEDLNLNIWLPRPALYLVELLPRRSAGRDLNPDLPIVALYQTELPGSQGPPRRDSNPRPSPALKVPRPPWNHKLFQFVGEGGFW